MTKLQLLIIIIIKMSLITVGVTLNTSSQGHLLMLFDAILIEYDCEVDTAYFKHLEKK